MSLREDLEHRYYLEKILLGMITRGETIPIPWLKTHQGYCCGEIESLQEITQCGMLKQSPSLKGCRFVSSNRGSGCPDTLGVCSIG